MNKDLNIEKMLFETIEKITGFTKYQAVIVIKESGSNLFTIKNEKFRVIYVPEVREANAGLVISKVIGEQKYPNVYPLVVTKFIAKKAGELLRNNNINYLEFYGVIDIRTERIFIFNNERIREYRKQPIGKLLDEAGIKLLHLLLNDPEKINLTYRELSKEAGVALGTVSNILKKMQKENHIVKAGKRRLLRNKNILLEKWLIAFQEVLKPKLIINHYNTLDHNLFTNFVKTETNQLFLWGGEPAAQILTQYLRPVKLTVYLRGELHQLIKLLKLTKDENGKIEVLEYFPGHVRDNKNIVDPLLIYADLLQGGYQRNVETANLIFNNYLKHLDDKNEKAL